MKFWLTTHWPARADDPLDGHPTGVWLQDGKLSAAKGMARDDLVLVYEAGSGMAVRHRYPDGSVRNVGRRRGRQGIIAMARIIDLPSQPEMSEPEQYADGSKRWWRYMAPTTILSSAGFVSRVDLAKALGYRPTFNFRGFGTGHSGLREISGETFDALKNSFVRSRSSADIKTKSTRAARRWGGQGGEGPAHLALKEAIARDPSGALGEPGLKHWATEYELPTGDRVDVVLQDNFGRFVAVEIEVDCDDEEIVGPLQCMKWYRALLSYMHDRRPVEVRSFPVAHSIHTAEVDRCGNFQVECHGIPRTSSWIAGSAARRDS